MSSSAPLILGVAGAVAGFLIGGPLGAAIGWSLGALGGNLLFPQRQEGPKLENLRLQTSSYGQMIPIIDGTMRVAGNVIWTTDLEPHEHTSGGKGGPSVTTTTYTASFAVLLCEGPIVGVPKAWALGETIWASGDPNCPFTVYYGTETQLPDSVMEADLGIGNVPGYRGRAYVVFEDFDLTNYGNSIPVLNFEVVTTAGSIPWRVSTFTPFSTPVISGVSFDGTILTIARWTPIPPDLFASPIELGITTRYQVKTFDINGVELTDETRLVPNIDGANTVTTSNDIVACMNNSRIARMRESAAGTDDVSQWMVDGFAGARPVGAPVGLDTYYSCAQEPVLLALDPDPANWKLYGISQVGGSDYYVSRWPAPDCHPQSGVDAFYHIPVTAGSYSLVAGDDGFIWLAEASGYLWKLDEDLNLIHEWTPADLPPPISTGTGSDHSFIVYNGYIASYTNNAAPGTGDAYTAFKIETDDTFTWVGQIPALTTSNVVSIGSGLAITGDGIISLNPPPTGVTLASIHTRRSVLCGLGANQIDVTELTDIVPGYITKQQQSGRDDILPLQSTYYYDVVESSGILKCVKRGKAPVISIPDDDLAATVDGSAAALAVSKRIKEADIPAVLNVSYINANNDYEIGTQIAQRQVTSSTQVHSIQLPINISDAKARQVANTLLFTAWLERTPTTLRTSRKYAYLEPTDVVTARGKDIRIMQKSDEASNIVQFDGVPSFQGLWNQAPIGSGSDGFTPTNPGASQATQFLLLDIPLVRDTDTPGFYVAMTGVTAASWRGASLYQSVDGAVTWNIIATSGTKSVIGTCSNALPTFTSNIFDEGSVLHVVIGNGGGTLSSATETAVLAGTNSCLIGSEIASFKNAVLTAPGEYDLSGWLRGRRGTEAFTVTHVIGERFVMLPVTNVAMPTAQLYHTYSYRAVTIGRTLAGAVTQNFANTGNALKPYSPTDVGGGCDASGNVTINWKRRTRIGGEWVDYVDVLLSEATEAYIVQIWDASYTICGRIISGLTTQTCSYTAANQVTDFGAVQQHVYFTVGQVGAFTLGAQTRGVAPSTGGSDSLPLVPIPPYVSPPIIPPPGPTAPVDIALNWPQDSRIVPMTIGQRKVCSFTTGASVPLTGLLSVVEYGSAATQRRCFIATDTGGLNIVPRSLSYGSSVQSFIGAASNGAILAAATTYYYIFDFIQPDNTLSGPPGFNAQTQLNLGNVTP